uniref:Endodeoxyribonuclease RusA n=1 Tax=Siphoviridae sp. ctvok7 TaxID=2827596 RepID=A0A8S5LLN2_9CAUD|nr:MAG TPA: Endodeoxyribonuclease RusA [Siphoviridae sp. ctvok7]
MIKITIPGRPITKKNSQRMILLKNGRRMVRPSAQFEAYQEAAGWAIEPHRGLMLTGPVNVKAVYFMPTRGRVDLLNLLEATCDILVHYGVLEDDNSRVVASHDGSRVFYDKTNPRVEIEITEVPER